MGVPEDYFAAIAADLPEDQIEATVAELRALCAVAIEGGRRMNPPV